MMMLNMCGHYSIDLDIATILIIYDLKKDTSGRLLLLELKCGTVLFVIQKERERRINVI